jgi:ABC-type methionine transport system ATPase subunit
MLSLSSLPISIINGDRQGKARIRIQIPSHYQKEPIISQLASQYCLEVNILAAILGANAQGSGWFDLQLTGQPDNLNQGLAYLQQLGVEILATSEPANENW